ncbi:hypothetical protein LCGC14_1142890 [marine sediment metagenome]|uniref:Transcriptional coactivator p15 (PC4) C-terminal domain-containing protein n=1 Tax=marine sediment metagenome TaxID=412755 RepID=A0A0F9M2K8_9ZZZZ|nr:transcriptional coactivator p15 [Candidatus Aminicenantes bacterium]HEB35911.1 transcriptional coactivator p15 [Candidatus Aminicenantes bacterium]
MDIYEIDKNSMEKIRIALTEFKGHRLLDIRVYYDASETRTPDFKPTKKGITIPIDLVREVKEGIDKALAEIESETGPESGENGLERPQGARSG